jgi:hypothetical protein
MMNIAMTVFPLSLLSGGTTSHSTRLSAEKFLIKLLAIPLGFQKTTAKWLVMAGHPKDDNQVAGYPASGRERRGLMEPLAIRLSPAKTPGKSLVIATRVLH